MQKKVVIQILVTRTADMEEKLERFFASFLEVKKPEGGMAVIITDHPSALGNMRGFLAEKVKLLHEQGFSDIELYESDENRGYAGGHAYAYEHFSLKYTPEYIYLLNEDTALDPDVFVKGIAYADAHQEAALVQSRIMLGDEREKMNCIGNAMQYLGFGYTIGHRKVYHPASSDEERRGGIPRFYASGAGLFVRTSVLKEIGGLFDPRYFLYHEDLDLAWRARLRGYDVACADESVVYHYYEFSRSIKKFYWMERNRIITHLTHLKIPTLLLIVIPFLCMEAGTFVFSLRSGWGREKLRVWKYFLQRETWAYIGDRRRHIQKMRTVSDREIFSHVTGIILSEEVKNPLLIYVVNPMHSAYFALLKKIILW